MVVHYPHLVLQGPTRILDFTNPQRGGARKPLPDRDRVNHSNYLRDRFQQAWNNFEQNQLIAHDKRHGAYIDFIGEPGFDLTVLSLESIKKGIRLLNIHKDEVGENEQTSATVYIPNNARNYFLNKINAYANELNKNGIPKNKKLIDSISDVRNAILESFWRPHERELIPEKDIESIEVWLSTDDQKVISQFETLLKNLSIAVTEGTLIFPERAVKIIQANREQLNLLIEMSDNIAECRIAKETAFFFINELDNYKQNEYVLELLKRTTFNDDTDIAVCILDTGINNGHRLIQPVLDDKDCHTVNDAWGKHDDNSHGTLMAGVVTYGDLLKVLLEKNPVYIPHLLESVKILPPSEVTPNPKELWGYMTLQGVSRAEIQAPQRKRVICMAVTSAEDRDRGKPSSWSAAVDELASGYIDGKKRLIIISAGNVDDPNNWHNYPEDNLTNSIDDPGQAWNALTVGAFTEKVKIVDPGLRGHYPVAQAGELSPYSKTSLIWAKGWPIKPEVVFEGGNVSRGPNNSSFNPDDLSLISTSHEPHVSQFSRFDCTSAATAQAGHMAAQIQAEYPTFWPETLRALITHSAEWTEAMRKQFITTPGKKDYTKLLKICGYGVPNLERALYCASNSLTLISQAELQPFDKRDNQYVTKDMHFYNLPWPRDILSELGEIAVTMRVTLSYFIEPGPGEVGWNNRYRYPSHMLRFAVNGPGETEDQFFSRINKQAREGNEGPETKGPGDKWVFGENARKLGSIHSDIWEGTAADLATSNLIAVYPVGGWWKERTHLNRWGKNCRYSLIVSILTSEENIDIYTPVATQIEVPISIDVESR